MVAALGGAGYYFGMEHFHPQCEIFGQHRVSREKQQLTMIFYFLRLKPYWCCLRDHSLHPSGRHALGG